MPLSYVIPENLPIVIIGTVVWIGWMLPAVFQYRRYQKAH